MTSDTLSMIAGVILSLAMSYIPGLSDRWDAMPPTGKRLTMAGLTLVVAAAAYALACYGIADQLDIKVACDQPGLIGLIRAWIAAVVAGQGAYALTPRRGRG